MRSGNETKFGVQLLLFVYNCRKLMEELISTEESYIRHMQLVVEVSSED